MANPDGSFARYELMTPGVAAAQRFYGDVTGWTFGGFPGGAPGHVVASATDPQGATFGIVAPQR